MTKKKELDSNELDSVNGGKPNLYKPETGADAFGLLTDAQETENIKSPLDLVSDSSNDTCNKAPLASTAEQTQFKYFFLRINEIFRNLFK